MWGTNKENSSKRIDVSSGKSSQGSESKPRSISFWK
jgi:hypothetical protein